MPTQSLIPQPSSLLGAFDRDPFSPMQRELDRLMGDFWRMPELRSKGSDGARLWPSLEIRETEKDYHVTADLAGLEQKDIQIDLNDNVLVLQGERRDTHSESSEGRCYTERSYGRFERRIPLDQEVDADRVEARIKNGVLDIDIPKSQHAQSKAHRIQVKPG
ncbi:MULTISPECIES: Hsp20/alpha crystallin family protein [unclassified Brevundimonas]|uniref:Hsp20/alpha crystallin family protein n=1 Tax=unclassified Brevundimonas TaxID=2622653 RepID=UPI003F8EA982